MTPAAAPRITNFDLMVDMLLRSKDLHVTNIICNIARDSPKQKKHAPRLEAHINALTEELGIHPERLAKEMSRAYPYGDVPDDIALQIATEACKQGPLTLRKGHYLYGNIVKIASELKRDYWLKQRGGKHMEDGNGKCFHEGDAVLYSELDNGRRIKAVY